MADPRERVRSEEGTRFEVTKPERWKLVAVAFVNVVFWREVVPVAVRFEVESPPKRARVVVVKAPRLVTL